MNERSTGEVTRLLIEWSHGDRGAMDRLMPLVYDELKWLASRHVPSARVDATLSATSLVNEAWLRLVDQSRVKWHDRAHFFGLAARIMRGILVDHARHRGRQKRGGGAPQISLDESVEVPLDRASELLVLDETLTRLSEVDRQQGQIVELRFFGGLTDREVATVLGISTATVTRRWRAARAWLHAELAGG